MESEQVLEAALREEVEFLRERIEGVERLNLGARLKRLESAIDSGAVIHIGTYVEQALCHCQQPPPPIPVSPSCASSAPRESAGVCVSEHTTRLLQLLEAARQRFWSLYDPADPTTAPRNHQVSDWLQSEHHVSHRMAEMMATLLRADDLPNRLENLD